MTVRVWLHRHDKELLAQHTEATLEHYAGEDSDELITGEIDGGELSHIKGYFVLGKVRFWEKKGEIHRIGWVRVDNHRIFPSGLALTPEDPIIIHYNKKSRTIDELTQLHRVQLFPAPVPSNDFIRQVFLTYNADIKVPKPHEHENHFLVYCNAQYLYKGKVVAWH